MSEPTGARRYGTGGGDAYYDAVKYGGYEGTREQFGKDQAEFATNATAVAAAKEVVEQDTEEVRSTKEMFVNTTVPDAITAIQQEGTTQVQAVTQQGEESSQQVEAVGTQWKDEVANEGRARVQAVEQAGTNQVQAVNDAGTTQVGAVNQAGTDQIAAVEQAGTGQVQAVTDEGTTQVTAVEDAGAAERTAIEEKGEQIRESIPDDYTALSDEVDNLNRQLSDVEENQIPELQSAFIGTNEFNGINNHIVTGALIQLATSKWVANADYSVLIANVSPGDRIGIIAGPTNATYYAFLTDDNVVIGETAPFAGDYTVPATLNASANAAITAPNNAKYLYITLGTLSTNRTPANLTNNGLDILATIPANIEAIETKTVNYVASLHQGARFAYNSTSVNKYFPFVIESGHTYKMVSAGVSVNVRYMDEMGGNPYVLTTNVGGQNPIKYATAEHDGSVIYFGSNGGAIDITITDVTYENINIIIDPNGNGDFKTLREGVAYAITRPHSKVYVNPGTYDLLTEFASEIAAAGKTQYGICLENDVHIVFSSGALVTALYTGNVQNVTTYFAPFYVGTNGGGFTLENLTIKASNTRYCVHDEYNGANVRTNNKYINCRFEFDNTTAPIDYYPQCIGGGVAKHSYVEIVGCYFKSKRAESQKTPLVSYHNASDVYVDDALSYINIRDCYFADTYGMFRFVYNGSYSEPVSVAYLQGNSFGMAPEVSAAGSATVVNVSILEWGNIVRT